nr:hypothetical protein [uncultured Prevotella sp.]
MAKSGVNKKWDAERVSQSVLYVTITSVVIVFVAFYLIGFNTPSIEDPAFNAPLLTDVLIYCGWLIFVFAVVTIALSVVKTIKMTSKSEVVVNKIPTRKLSFSVFGLTIASLILSLLLGSSNEMLINGIAFTDKLWLKVADMFVYSSLVLLLAAIASVVFGATRYYRKKNKNT